MGILHKDLVIDYMNEGFDALDENGRPKDQFGRKPLGLRLLSLFSSTDESLVIALDEPWGTGKTVFAKQLVGEVTVNSKSEGYMGPGEVIYFDAFANDFIGDPFTALVGELSLKFKEAKLAEKGALIALGATKGLLEAGLSKVPGAKEIKKQVEEQLEAGFKENLENYKKAKKAVSDFRGELEKLTQGGPILVIIDELDRCKPTFALEMLEKIKHFFNVPGLHFLLVANMEQLYASVKMAYGLDDTTARIYLEKFISDDVCFDKKSIAQAGGRSIKLGGTYIGNYAKNLDRQYSAGSLLARFPESAPIYVGSLRALNRHFAKFSRVLSGVGLDGGNSQGVLYEILLLVRGYAPSLYKKIKNGDASWDDIVDQLGGSTRELFGFSDQDVIQACKYFLSGENFGLDQIPVEFHKYLGEISGGGSSAVTRDKYIAVIDSLEEG